MSEADSELLHALTQRAVDWVTPTILERWRLADLLPAPERRGLGRGKGSASRYPPEAEVIATVLAEHTFQGRSRHYGTIAVLLSNLPVGERPLKDALAWFLRRKRHQTLRARQHNPEAIYERAEAGARPGMAALKASTLGLAENIVRPTRAERSAQTRRRRQLAEAASIAFVMAYEDPSEIHPDQLADAFERWFPGEIGDALGQAVRSLSPGELVLDPVIQPGTERSIAALEATSMDQLLEIHRAIELAGFVWFGLVFCAAFFAEAQELLQKISRDPLTQTLVGSPMLRPTTDPTAYALLVHGHVASPGYHRLQRQTVEPLVDPVMGWLLDTMNELSARGAIEEKGLTSEELTRAKESLGAGPSTLLPEMAGILAERIGERR